MTNYEIIIKNEKTKFYDRFALFIFLLNGIFLTLALFNSNKKLILDYGSYLFLLLFIAVNTFPLIHIFLNIVSRKFLSFVIASFIISLFWVLLGYWWAGMLFFVLILLYIASKRPFIIKVDQKNIFYPSFPSKTINWEDLNQLILKDGLLTIDFKNNKIIQQLIAEFQSIDEKEFNDFCLHQVNK